MNILIFGPFNYRARDNESLMLKFREMGHQVFFLTMDKGIYIIPFLETHGIHCFRMGIKIKSRLDVFRQVYFLFNFIRKHRINLVFSHLEPANLISVMAQYLTISKIIIVRHHSDDIFLSGAHMRLAYKFTYKFAKKILVVSSHAKKIMIEKEKISPDKIEVVPLSYNFSLFDRPNFDTVDKIKQQYAAPLLILCAGRLVPNKKFDLALNIAGRLVTNGVEFKMLLLGEGELYSTLKQLISDKNLEQHCFLLGYKANMMDYLESCDVLLHPSISESSSVILKEAGLREKAVIACEGVGDFNEIITNYFNGILFPVESFETDVANYLTSRTADPYVFPNMGRNLNKSIQSLFNIEKNIDFYHKFIG